MSTSSQSFTAANNSNNVNNTFDISPQIQDQGMLSTKEQQQQPQQPQPQPQSQPQSQSLPSNNNNNNNNTNKQDVVNVVFDDAFSWVIYF